MTTLITAVKETNTKPAKLDRSPYLSCVFVKISRERRNPIPRDV